LLHHAGRYASHVATYNLIPAEVREKLQKHTMRLKQRNFVCSLNQLLISGLGITKTTKNSSHNFKISNAILNKLKPQKGEEAK
jgi:hypothetical protein